MGYFSLRNRLLQSENQKHYKFFLNKQKKIKIDFIEVTVAYNVSGAQKKKEKVFAVGFNKSENGS
jgi:hypothetical protein